MFDSLSDRLNTVFKKLKGHGKLTEKNIEDGLREVRMALLEADVHFKVVKQLLGRVREQATGQEIAFHITAEVITGIFCIIGGLGVAISWDAGYFIRRAGSLEYRCGHKNRQTLCY